MPIVPQIVPQIVPACAPADPRSPRLQGMSIYRRGTVFWWKSRLRLSFVSTRSIIVRISLRTASPNQARSRAAELDLARNAILEQLPVLRQNVTADDMPKLYKRAFERELNRILLAQFSEPGRLEDHHALNRHYARFFTLLATEPTLLDASLDSFEELRRRGLSEADAEALHALCQRHQGQLPISARQIAADLRDVGLKPTTSNLKMTGRVTATGYRDASIEACRELGMPLANTDIWPLPPQLAGLARSERFSEQDVPSEASGPEKPEPLQRGEKPEPAKSASPLLSECAKEAIGKRIADGAWEEGRKRDVNAAVAIFIAANGDMPVHDITQQHLVAMKDVFPRLPVVYGRERKDADGMKVRETINEAVARGDALKLKWDEDSTKADDDVLSYVGLSLTTQRKHLTWLRSLITYLEGHDPGHTPSGLNFTAVRKTLVQPKMQGARYSVKGKQKKNAKRLGWRESELRALFLAPVWQGCAGLWNRFTKGSEIFHDGSYWVLPLVTTSVSRSDEIAGLSVHDIFSDCEVPYMHIRETNLRRIKNTSSDRRVPIAKIILALGFREYIEAIKAAGYNAAFPEFQHPTMEFEKTFRKDLFEPLRKLVFPDGTSRKRGRKDVDVQSIRTFGFSVLKVEHERTKDSSFDKDHRQGLGGHEPGDTTSGTYEEDFEPVDLVPQVEFLASLLPHLPVHQLNLRPPEWQKFGKPRGRRKILS